jgi:hypothetical protein
MELDLQQKKTVSAWIAQGMTLSEIQKRIVEEFHLTLTYLDIRFLVDDLGVKLKDRETPKPSKARAIGKADGPQDDDGLGMDQGLAAPGGRGAGGVRVETDRVLKPGALVSGTVTFSDGQTAEWLVDEMGRPGLIPRKRGYRPSQEDMMAFQRELAETLRRKGY